jgi:hypothetical protein
MIGCPQLPAGKGITVFRRSGKGLHLSKAALKHAANHIYRTRLAAFLDRAHRGDKAKVVQITINNDLYNKAFPSGTVAADLRLIL